MSLTLALTLVLSAVPTPPQWLGPKVTAPPRRVVTLAPSLTELVLELGGGERLVGVSRFDERPEVKHLPRVGGFVDPSVEAVVGLKPDLVLVQPGPGNRAPVEKMATLGVSILALPLHSVPEVLQALRTVGEVLGEGSEAEARVASFEAARQRFRHKAQAHPRVKVLMVYGFSPLVVAGPGSYAHDLLNDVGGLNAASLASSAFSSYSVETALRGAPELILDLSEEPLAAERFRKKPGFDKVRWAKPSSRRLMHPGPALESALEELFLLLHPPG